MTDCSNTGDFSAALANPLLTCRKAEWGHQLQRGNLRTRVFPWPRPLAHTDTRTHTHLLTPLPNLFFSELFLSQVQPYPYRCQQPCSGSDSIQYDQLFPQNKNSFQTRNKEVFLSPHLQEALLWKEI